MDDRSIQTLRLASTVTCPPCGHVATETMPTDACIYFYEWEFR